MDPDAAVAAHASTRPRRTGADRALAPDVARGLALVGIAVVNAGLLAPHAVASGLDRTVAVAVTLLVENRTWPMFAVLFGWGITAILARADATGAPGDGRRSVVRRSLFLVGVGALQVVLVFWADILAVYGLTALVAVAVARRSRGVLLVLSAVSLATWGIGTAAAALVGGSDAVPSSADWAVSIGERLGVFVFWTTSNVLLLTHLAPMLVGVLLFRAGVLQRPGAHLPLLRRIAVLGGAASVLGAVPLALGVAGVWAPSAVGGAAALGLHAVTGVAGGVAAVAVVALWSCGGARGPLARALAATGRRPLTAYLVHSVLLGLLLSAWAADLGARASVAGTALVGTLVGCVCVGVCVALEARGVAGPADVLLRRITRGSRRVTPARARS